MLEDHWQLQLQPIDARLGAAACGTGWRSCSFLPRVLKAAAFPGTRSWIINVGQIFDPETGGVRWALLDFDAFEKTAGQAQGVAFSRMFKRVIETYAELSRHETWAKRVGHLVGIELPQGSGARARSIMLKRTLGVYQYSCLRRELELCFWLACAAFMRIMC